METCGTEEPDEGKLHVRICGGGWLSNRRLYLDATLASLASPGHPFLWVAWAGIEPSRWTGAVSPPATKAGYRNESIIATNADFRASWLVL